MPVRFHSEVPGLQATQSHTCEVILVAQLKEGWLSAVAKPEIETRRQVTEGAEEQSSVAEEINLSVTNIQQVLEETALGASQIVDQALNLPGWVGN